MQKELRIALDQLLKHESLSSDMINDAIGAIMDERCSDIETAALLTALAVKGETEDELAGAALAMRKRATRIPSRLPDLLDTCGTGGDRMQTFNISTAAAFVTAAAGVPVAKHGNRSVSSSSGSADVLESLGVHIGLTAEQAGACLDELGLCFCYARTFHTAMKHVGPVRQQLGFRTIFNLLGPLTNPAGAQFQLIGVSTNLLAKKIAHAVGRLGLKRAIVVCGNNELDEVALWGTTQVWDVTPAAIQVFSWSATDFGLPECQPDQLKVNSKEESAQVIQNILNGMPGPQRNIVVANAAMALYCRGAVSTLPEGARKAASVLDEGHAARLLKRLVEYTHQV